MKEKKGCCSRTFHPVRKEFDRDNIRFDHSPVDDFFKSQWQTDTKCWIYIIYRWLLAIFFTGGVLFSAIVQFYNGTYFIYLTNCGFILCMLTSLLGASLATIWYLKPDKYVTQTCLLKFFWGLHITTLSLALIITIVYWGALYPMVETDYIGVFNVFAHACNSVLMVVDQMVVAFPTRILHVIYPMALGLLYAIFSLIYYFAGGLDMFGNSYIYPILDWDKPGLAIGSICGVCALLCISMLFNFSLYKLRTTIYRKTRKSQLYF